jgi:FkbM family methyltransferase
MSFIKRIVDGIKRRTSPIFRRMEERAKEYSWKGFTLEYSSPISTVVTPEYGRILLRNHSSDFQVFEQIIYLEEYKSLFLAGVDNKIEPEIIVDAGANIGLTSIYFLHKFPNAKIYAIEPIPENISALKLNMKKQTGKDRFHLFEGALWKSGAALAVDYSFGDGKEWSRAVIEQGDSDDRIAGATIEVLMKQWNLTHIDIFKIDIEGTEKIIFEKAEGCSFLTMVKIISIEIHNHLNCREQIVGILRSYGFFVFQNGESTIGFNSRFQEDRDTIKHFEQH